jgi:chromosome segregation ATPase
MRLKSLEIAGFKSFAKKDKLDFESPISAIVGPNGSGKSNIAESFRFVLGEQSMKSMRGKKGEDLIFNGNNKVSRQNKAGVKLVFDNSDKLLKVDFDEVAIERVVHRDGANEYFLNGSKVRLKDIQEMLAGANIGASGHHIVSQGDADRILNTSIKERKAMLQDALGLRVFEYKKHEATRKLEKTADNIKEVESLRREIAPHLRFLKKQVEKIEKAKELQEQLKELYLDYLSKEDKYLDAKDKELKKDVVAPEKELHEIDKKISSIKESIEKQETGEDQLKMLQIEKGELKSKISKIEGQVSSYETLVNQETKLSDSVSISRDELNSLYEDLKRQKDSIDSQNEVEGLKRIFSEVFEKIKSFVDKFKGEDQSDFKEDLRIKIQDLSKEKEALGVRLQALEKDLESLESTEKKDSNSQLEVIDLMNRKNELEIAVSKLQNEKRILETEKEEFKREVAEAVVLIGREVSSYESVKIEGNILEESRQEQKDKRKDLERMKIRLEEMGGAGGAEIMKEFEEVSERDVFLEKEIGDLKESSESLDKLIAELTEEIEKRFKGGLDKINKEFTKFFSLMFGGGEASLRIEREKVRGDFEEEEEQYEEGIGIHVNLPRKKIRGLMMLSGGERALTSIALLFAMSAVNPPPFVILDETDAALDEANSKKYGDMIATLAEESQLILVTHNRETMSRAGIIYGVTMTDGVSQILSIKFDEAVRVAK